MRNVTNIPFEAILTPKQMSLVKGGLAVDATVVSSTIVVDAAVGSTLNATSDDKRRERPGGGITTH